MRSLTRWSVIIPVAAVLLCSGLGCTQDLTSEPYFANLRGRCFELTLDTYAMHENDAEDGEYTPRSATLDAGIDSPPPSPEDYKRGDRLLPRGTRIQVEKLFFIHGPGLYSALGRIVDGPLAGHSIGVNYLCDDGWHKEFLYYPRRMKPCGDSTTPPVTRPLNFTESHNPP